MDHLGRTAKSTTRSLLALEHEMSHCLFRSSAMFSVYKSDPSRVKFIPEYFLIEDATVNGHLFVVYCHYLGCYLLLLVSFSWKWPPSEAVQSQEIRRTSLWHVLS